MSVVQDDASLNDENNEQEELEEDFTSETVIGRIENLLQDIVSQLDNDRLPVLEGNGITKAFGQWNQCRSFTNIVLVLSYCHALLLANRTTTTREVYYFYVTHFRSHKECCAAIWDAAELLGVPRHALGLHASPRGWWTGDIQLTQDGVCVLDGRHLQSIQGATIGSEWLGQRLGFDISTFAAKCILVIEKEGIYKRLSEDRFYDRYPCVIVTGRGFPDLATRACVHHLHQALRLPVYGVCDSNPFGVMVLHTYQESRRSSNIGVPMKWIGLRPCQIQQLGREGRPLPRQVFQELTQVDEQRLEGHLLSETHGWIANAQDPERRIDELRQLRQYKVELEALNWLGMDFFSDWLARILEYSHEGDEDGEEWMEII